MWDPYLKAIKMVVPHTVAVFDKFHIIRSLLKVVNDVCKQEAESKKKIDPDILKGTRIIWSRNPWNLNDIQKQCLSYLEKLNLKISRAYLLKEQFRDLWTYHRSNDAKHFPDYWFDKATHSQLKPMSDFA